MPRSKTTCSSVERILKVSAWLNPATLMKSWYNISIFLFILFFRYALQAMPLTQFLYYQIPGNKIIVNPCRDQNYRKYFEMRKKNGIQAPISE